ncbi:MAG TPA: AI-2E family transporter, partial [Firmicutes bacterium]|nr:AI-2E family transporter [Bacillota bacterium]
MRSNSDPRFFNKAVQVQQPPVAVLGKAVDNQERPFFFSDSFLHFTVYYTPAVLMCFHQFNLHFSPDWTSDVTSAPFLPQASSRLDNWGSRTIASQAEAASLGMELKGRMGYNTHKVTPGKRCRAMWNSKLFKAGIGLLLLFLIIYVGSQITFIFYPLVVAFEALFISFLVAGILYYFTYPSVDWLHNHKIPRPLAIIMVFLIIVGLLVLLGIILGPILQGEFTKLTVSIPDKIREARQLIQQLEENELITRFFDLESLNTLNLENLAERAAALVSSTFSQLASSITAVLDFLANIFMTVIIIPFLLYYMLKEKGHGLIT